MEKQEVISAEKVRRLIWDTMQGVKTGAVSVQSAVAVAYNARELIKICKYEFDVSRFTGARPHNNQFPMLEHLRPTKRGEVSRISRETNNKN